MGQPAATERERHPWTALALVMVLVAVLAIVLVRITGTARPAIEYRPAIVDLVTSVAQRGASWDVGLESGAHVTLTAAVRDVLRPVSGPPLAPGIGDLMLADSLPAPSWVAFSSGGGAAGEECYPINEGAVADGDRIVFRSGLSVPIGSWRREPLPSPGLELAGACLDRRGSAVEKVLGPA